MAARNEQFIEDVVRELHDDDVEALAVKTDITDADQCDRLVATTLERYGQLDVLVNNA